MKLASRIAAMSLSVLVTVGLAGCGGEGGDKDGFTTRLQLGTGSVGGVYFPLGQEYANLFEKHIDVDGLSVDAVESGASVENLAKIGRGDLQLGLTQNNTMELAVKGHGEFGGAKVDNVGLLGRLYPETAQVITLESSGIDSIADLKGKRVATGPPGSGTNAVAEAILKAYGIGEGDYKPLAEGFADAKAKLQDGNVDASIEILGVPGASLQELHSATGEVKLLPIEGDKLDAIVKNSDFEPYEIPAGAYEFLDEPVSTVSVFAMMAASTTQVSEDLGYEITRVLYEHAGDLTLAQKEHITLEDALVGRGDLPLHPGAEKYFKEQGIL